MQIIDREEDWILDSLAVRDGVESLNEVFMDPAIVKVRFLLYRLFEFLIVYFRFCLERRAI